MVLVVNLTLFKLVPQILVAFPSWASSSVSLTPQLLSKCWYSLKLHRIYLSIFTNSLSIPTQTYVQITSQSLKYISSLETFLHSSQKGKIFNQEPVVKRYFMLPFTYLQGVTAGTRIAPLLYLRCLRQLTSYSWHHRLKLPTDGVRTILEMANTPVTRTTRTTVHANISDISNCD